MTTAVEFTSSPIEAIRIAHLPPQTGAADPDALPNVSVDRLWSF
jgi:hypothetical protein